MYVCMHVCSSPSFAYIFTVLVRKQRHPDGTNTDLSGLSQTEKLATPVNPVYDAISDDTPAKVSSSELHTLSSGQGQTGTPREYVYQTTPRMTEIKQGYTNPYEQSDADNNEESYPYETIHM